MDSVRLFEFFRLLQPCHFACWNRRNPCNRRYCKCNSSRHHRWNADRIWNRLRYSQPVRWRQQRQHKRRRLCGSTGHCGCVSGRHHHKRFASCNGFILLQSWCIWCKWSHRRWCDFQHGFHSWTDHQQRQRYGLRRRSQQHCSHSTVRICWLYFGN